MIVRFSHLVDRVNRTVGGVFSSLCIVVMLCGTYEVFVRYFFNNPTIWVWEQNGLLVLVIAALGGGYCLLVGGHIKVDVVSSHWSERTKAIVDSCTSVFIFLFLGVLLWQGVKVSLVSFRVAEHSETVYGPLLWPYKVALTVGAFLFLMQGVANFTRSLLVAVTGKRAHSEH